MAHQDDKDGVYAAMGGIVVAAILCCLGVLLIRILTGLW